MYGLVEVRGVKFGKDLNKLNNENTVKNLFPCVTDATYIPWSRVCVHRLKTSQEQLNTQLWHSYRSGHYQSKDLCIVLYNYFYFIIFASHMGSQIKNTIFTSPHFKVVVNGGLMMIFLDQNVNKKILLFLTELYWLF